MTDTVLLLGAGGPAGENFTRSARAAGWRVFGCDVDQQRLALSSADGTFAVPPVDGKDRAGIINRIAAQVDATVIHAQPDVEAFWLACHCDDITWPRAMVPHPSVMTICQDKLATARKLEPHGLALDSEHIRLPRDIREAFDRLGRPLWFRMRRGAGSMGALPSGRESLAVEWIEHWSIMRGRKCAWGEWMAQPVLTGRVTSWTGVFRHGDLLASGLKERRELHGASRSPAGVSSTASLQAVIAEPALAKFAERACREITDDPHGVLMVDMRHDAVDRPWVTEINAGRFGTTSEFWAQAGCNLVGAYLDAAVGRDVPEQHPVAGAVQVRDMDMGSTVLLPEREEALA